MSQNPREVSIANLLFIAFWLAVVLFIIFAARFFPSIQPFRDKMLTKWKPAAAIAGLFLVSMGLGGRSLINPYAIAIFCEALLGLTLASGLDFEPLPLASAISQRKQVFRQFLLIVLISLLAVLPALIIGTIGLDIGKHIFGETNLSQQAQNMLPANKWLTFFLLLGGAGLAEETMYRLLSLSFFWKVTRRKWLAVIFSALLFGAYHLSPLNGMYRIFWQFPISQFLASVLIGLVWGWLFVKRGYETAVLGHTLSDWLPMMLFT